MFSILIRKTFKEQKSSEKLKYSTINEITEGLKGKYEEIQKEQKDRKMENRRKKIRKPVHKVKHPNRSYRKQRAEKLDGNLQNR